jgi:lysophospholipase L1-like esterase
MLMKPSGILVFLLLVFILLFAGAIYFPEDGIKISKNLHLRFFTTKKLLSQKEIKYADIDKILRQHKYLNDSILTTIAENEISATKTLQANADSLINAITPIEYPNNDPTIFYPFFRSLKNLPASGQLIRIMHYGDSQIEDDRITALLRNKLQTQFGGSGAGLVPASQLYPYGFSMKQDNSGNWLRHIGFGKIDTAIKHRRYGVLASYSMFMPNGKTDGNDSIEAWVKFSKSPYSYHNTRKYRQCRIFYSQNKEPFLNEIYFDNKLADAEIFPATNYFKVIRWTFDNSGNEMMLKFKGHSSPEIYGIALDNEQGVAVDNIPLRGCSGLFFTLLDEQLMTEMYKELNVKLFILQFGGNFVPAGLENYQGYETWFSNQLNRIKKLCPWAAILVIGVADMSIKENNKYITNPNVEKVRNALKNAAFNSGAAFWDMYQAMGGKNSMPSWVSANPPLASSDYVHFNPQGAKTIAQMFYNSFILEYRRFEKHEQ